MSNRGIPTTYNGQRFRSRLEAKWAAFFDIVGWRWEYEPMDLDGYIPDFILRFKEPLLAEVKPATTRAELERAEHKIEQSGWAGEYLLLGAVMFEGWAEMRCSSEHAIGLVGGTACGFAGLNDACVHLCTGCDKITLTSCQGYQGCRVSGCYNGGHYRHLNSHDVQRIWRDAANAVQWSADRSQWSQP